MPIEVGFILKHLAAQADREPTLRTQQPWKAAYRYVAGAERSLELAKAQGWTVVR